jgi:hypothetical protein
MIGTIRVLPRFPVTLIATPTGTMAPVSATASPTRNPAP